MEYRNAVIGDSRFMTEMFGDSLSIDDGLSVAGGLTAPVRMALTLLNCRNVVVIDKQEPKRLRQARPTECPPMPRLTYKTLGVQPMQPKVQTGGNGKGPQPSRGIVPLHFCRGHFKDYRHGKGLFGKYRNQYWWAQQWRGNSEQGVVIKDYELQTDT